MKIIQTQTYHPITVERYLHGSESDSIIILQRCNHSDVKSMHVVIGIDGLVELIDELIKLLGETNV